jgi:anion-transporting  ArsA/GET3 family ATPase
MKSFDLDGLLARRMVLVSGKGGVGKTTVAAALALLAVRRGLRVLLAQFESNVDAGLLLGHRRVGTEVAEVQRGLWAVNMTPKTALREYGLLIFRFRAIQRAVMENRMVRYFLKAMPGLDDYSMLGKVWHHTTQLEAGQNRFDLVVVDCPPTGQTIRVLGVPRSIVNSVPDSMFSRDARTIHGFLTNPERCGVIIVALAEELPVSEALELETALRNGLQLDVAALVVNALYPRRRCPELEDLPPDAFDEDPRLAVLHEESRIFDQRRGINDHYLGVVAEQSAAPLVRLPLLFVDRLGPAELNRLTDRLEDRTFR